MPDFRRYFIPGGTYFFTLVTCGREPFLCEEIARKLLRSAILNERSRRPFEIVAMVLLPDHLHAIWALPPGDAQYPLRWSAIKSEFTREWLRAGGREQRVTAAQKMEERRGVWQPRYFEHTIQDEDDLHQHADYIHYNPVKHGYASSPVDWLWTSFHRFVLAGHYPIDWGRGVIETPRVRVDLAE